MDNIKRKLEKEESQIISDKSTKRTYTPPQITQLIMNEVVEGGVSAFNEAQSGIINS